MSFLGRGFTAWLAFPRPASGLNILTKYWQNWIFSQNVLTGFGSVSDWFCSISQINNRIQGVVTATGWLMSLATLALAMCGWASPPSTGRTGMISKDLPFQRRGSSDWFYPLSSALRGWTRIPHSLALASRKRDRHPSPIHTLVVETTIEAAH